MESEERMFRKVAGVHGASRKAMITVDGQPVAVDEGESVAAVLLRLSPFKARDTPVSGAPRAPYCMMGVCFECLVEIDGASSSRSCLVAVRDGMTVKRQVWRPDPAAEIAA